jgi:uncharacterized protein (TIGR03067 family)
MDTATFVRELKESLQAYLYRRALDDASAPYELLLAQWRILHLARYALVAYRWDSSLDGATQLAAARRTVARRLGAFPVLGPIGLQVVFCGPREQWEHHVAAMPADLTGWHTVIVHGVHFVDPQRGERALNQSSWRPLKFGGAEGIAGQIDLILRECVGPAEPRSSTDTESAPPANRSSTLSSAVVPNLGLAEPHPMATDGVGTSRRKPSMVPWLIFAVVLAAGIVTAVLLLGNMSKSPTAAEDQEALRGVWLLRNSTDGSPMSLEFDYPKAKMTTFNEVTWFTFRIDTSQTPAHLDLIPSNSNREPMLLIYQLEGDTLRIGYTLTTTGVGDRPTEFSPPTVWIFTRLH